jgi:trehalose synthase
MLQPIAVGHKSLADYTHVAGKPLTEEIRELAGQLSGLRVLHISATAFGGGVSEILYTLVPLMNDVGIEAERQVMLGREEFYNVTKLLHNALQGNPQGLSPEEWQVFAKYNEMNALDLSSDWDVIIIHDPQPAAIHQHVPERARRWIWRCHIDLSEPNPTAIERMVPLIRSYDRAVFHLPDYVPDALRQDGATVTICPPAIDPLSPKNMAFSPEDAAYVCNQFGIDVDRPLLVQVSRFDPWKDPMGVIDAYRRVTEQVPDVQLALVGSMATDDPEGWEFFNETVAYADGDPDIHILNNLNNVGAIEVNAFQSQADVVIQKSTREGFGLTVSEALWKARPFIGGNVGGIPLQVQNGETGYLVSSPEECADRALEVLREPGLGKFLGRAGKEHVRRHFLTPRLLRDWLKIFAEES